MSRRGKKNNPLSWDFTGLPDSILNNRMFRSYRHDQKATKEDRLSSRKKRMRGLTSVLPRKKADTIEKWLPSTELIVVPRNGMTLKEGKALGEQFSRENKVLVVADAQDLIDSLVGQEHQFTPFMMLHDVMEYYIDQSQSYRFDWSPHIKELKNIDEKMHELTLSIDAGDEPFHKFGFYKEIKISQYLPRISSMHLKEANQRMKRIHRSLFRINLGTQYALQRDFQNKLSDLFALWAMNENLTEDQLIFLGDDEYNEILSNPYTFFFVDSKVSINGSLEQREEDGKLFDEYKDKVRNVYVNTGTSYPKKQKTKIVQLLNNLFIGVLQSMKKDGFVPIPSYWSER